MITLSASAAASAAARPIVVRSTEKPPPPGAVAGMPIATRSDFSRTGVWYQPPSVV